MCFLLSHLVNVSVKHIQTMNLIPLSWCSGRAVTVKVSPNEISCDFNPSIDILPFISSLVNSN